jgi:hypothetical protein
MIISAPLSVISSLSAFTPSVGSPSRCTFQRTAALTSVLRSTTAGLLLDAARFAIPHQSNKPKPRRSRVGSDAYAEYASCLGAARRTVCFFLGFSGRASGWGCAVSALATFFWTGGLLARLYHLVWSESAAFSADISMTRTFFFGAAELSEDSTLAAALDGFGATSAASADATATLKDTATPAPIHRMAAMQKSNQVGDLPTWNT